MSVRTIYGVKGSHFYIVLETDNVEVVYAANANTLTREHERLESSAIVMEYKGTLASYEVENGTIATTVLVGANKFKMVGFFKETKKLIKLLNKCIGKVISHRGRFVNRNGKVGLEVTYMALFEKEEPMVFPMAVKTTSTEAAAKHGQHNEGGDSLHSLEDATEKEGGEREDKTGNVPLAGTLEQLNLNETGSEELNFAALTYFFPVPEEATIIAIPPHVEEAMKGVSAEQRIVFDWFQDELGKQKKELERLKMQMPVLPPEF